MKYKKSGGARIITLVLAKYETIYLISVYDKNKFDTVEIETLLLILKEEGL